MSANSKIEWTDHTFNPWIGCSKVSPACDHCYAAVSTAARALHVEWGAGQPRRRTSEANWKEPIKWNARHEREMAEWVKLAAGIGGRDEAIKRGFLPPRRQRVFCASLADVFDNEVPMLWRQNLLSLIADTPNLDWLLLTKRIGNVERMLQEACLHDGRLMDASDRYRPLENVWIGATIANQEEADRDIPKLLQVPAAVRFLSMEPLLGPVDLTWLAQETDGVYDSLRGGSWILGNEQVHPVLPNWRYCDGTSSPREYLNTRRLMGRHVDWVIVGGESGPHARPMHPDWARSLRDQCATAGVPFLFKQWGEWLPFPDFPSQDISIHRADVVEYAGIYLDGTSSRDSFRYPLEIAVSMYKVGKKEAGRLLDGISHNGFPKGAA
jgi:protein gp37